MSNPIVQNKGHLKALDAVLEGKYTHVFYSLIIFSERCELKSIHIHSKDVVVIKRNLLLRVLHDLMGRSSSLLDHETTEKLYNQLKPYTQVDEVTKERHIANMRASM